MSKCYVFSIFCNDVGDYPYLPFIAKSVDEGIHRYRKFLSEVDSICPHPELHIIGRCTYNTYSKNIDYNYLEPYVIPVRVEFKNNLFSRCVMLSYRFRDLFNTYLNRLSVYYEKLKGRKNV